MTLFSVHQFNVEIFCIFWCVPVCEWVCLFLFFICDFFSADFNSLTQIWIKFRANAIIRRCVFLYIFLKSDGNDFVLNRLSRDGEVKREQCYLFAFLSLSLSLSLSCRHHECLMFYACRRLFHNKLICIWCRDPGQVINVSYVENIWIICMHADSRV